MSGKHYGWSEVDREYLSSGSPLKEIFFNCHDWGGEGFPALVSGGQVF